MLIAIVSKVRTAQSYPTAANSSFSQTIRAAFHIYPELKLAGRNVISAELVGAALAYICSYLLSGYQWCTALVASLIVLLLILRGLAPWSSVANPFSWIPFSGFLAADREFGMLKFTELGASPKEEIIGFRRARP